MRRVWFRESRKWDIQDLRSSPCPSNCILTIYLTLLPTHYFIHGVRCYLSLKCIRGLYSFFLFFFSGLELGFSDLKQLVGILISPGWGMDVALWARVKAQNSRKLFVSMCYTRRWTPASVWASKFKTAVWLVVNTEHESGLSGPWAQCRAHSRYTKNIWHSQSQSSFSLQVLAEGKLPWVT